MSCTFFYHTSHCLETEGLIMWLEDRRSASQLLVRKISVCRDSFVTYDDISTLSHSTVSLNIVHSIEFVFPFKKGRITMGCIILGARKQRTEKTAVEC